MTTDEQLARGWFKEGVETFLKDKHAATFNTPDYYYASGYLRAKQEARIAALTKDAEPVAVVNAAFTDGEFDKQKLVAVLVNTVKLGDLLYTHPPAPKAITPEMQWQPIETAPKDVDALILVANTDGVWAAKYQPIYQSGFIPENPWSSMLINHDHITVRESDKPTHWMPLPKPPIAAAVNAFNGVKP